MFAALNVCMLVERSYKMCFLHKEVYFMVASFLSMINMFYCSKRNLYLDIFL